MKGRRRRTDGFSLIEILVVLAIISLLLTITTPSLKSFSENRKLRAAADSVKSLFLFARDVAMTEGEAYIVVFDLDEQRYWLAKSAALELGDLSQTVGLGAYGPQEETTSGGASTESTSSTTGDGSDSSAVPYSRASGVLGQPRSVIQAIRLEQVEVDRDGAVSATATGYEYVTFASDGTAEPASVYFTNIEGRGVVVDLPQDARRVRVRDLSENELADLGFTTESQ